MYENDDFIFFLNLGFFLWWMYDEIMKKMKIWRKWWGLKKIVVFYFYFLWWMYEDIMKKKMKIWRKWWVFKKKL